VVAVAAVWHGGTDLMYELIAAIAHNCECQGPRICSAHKALMDQRFTDGVLFARFLLPQLRREEFSHRGRVRSQRA
jgi:hypothetical protein